MAQGFRGFVLQGPKLVPCWGRYSNFQQDRDISFFGESFYKDYDILGSMLHISTSQRWGAPYTEGLV